MVKYKKLKLSKDGDGQVLFLGIRGIASLPMKWKTMTSALLYISLDRQSMFPIYA
jgi:hypothetical protein